jgi:predicted transcriptional regulator
MSSALSPEGRWRCRRQTAVFTVKLPVQLVARVRAHAAESGRTISSVVTQALEELLSRGRRERPRK